MPNFISSLFSGLWTVVVWIFKKWKLSLTLISILILFFTSFVSSIQMKSPMPVIKDIGGKMVNSDNNIYIKSDEILNSGDRWTTLKALSYIFKDLWIVILIGIIIYSLVCLQDRSEILKNIAITFVILFVLQLCFNFYLLSDSENQYTYSEKAKFVVPFKGVFHFLSTMPKLIEQQSIQSLNIAGE